MSFSLPPDQEIQRLKVLLRQLLPVVTVMISEFDDMAHPADFDEEELKKLRKRILEAVK